MSVFDLPDDEWDEIEPAIKSGASLPVIQLRLSIMRGRKALAFMAFRGEAMAWIKANEPRFRAQIGGPQADKIRIVPDALSGRFEFVECKGGTLRMNLGHVTAWPNETRTPVGCQYRIDSVPHQIIVVTPTGFAAPTPTVTQPLAKAQLGRIIDRRPTEPVSLGDPPPGRSALDQKRGVR